MAFAKKLFFTALFLSILTEATTTSKDPWSGGFSWYFHADLKSWLPQIGIPLNPFEVTMIIILLVWALRGRRDRRFHFERGLLFWPIVAFGSIMVLSLLWGIVHAGSDFTIALWEIRSLAYGFLAYFLVGILFTHRRDLDTLTWVVLLSAMLMGIECIIRYYVFLHSNVSSDLDYDHEDATLLAFAILLSMAMILLGSSRRQRYLALVSIPLDTIAMMLTHRRAGFGALAVGLVFLAIILLRVNRRLFMRIVPVTALILAIYVGVEWNCSYGALCQPARAISSQFNPDPRDASSNAYRIAERNDLILNIQANTITGLGVGQPFAFYIPLPNLSFWRFWQYTPHNEILWIWVKMGMFGFMAFWWLISSALYRSGRLTQALSAAGDNKARALLAAAACLIVMQMTVSYVDLGLTSDRIMLVMGVMFGVIGHLPGILRRSTNTDVPTRRARPVNSRTSTALEHQTPEVQVGILAHALLAPPESASSSRRGPASSRPNTRKGWEPRWDQNKGSTNGAANGASGWVHPNGAGSGAVDGATGWGRPNGAAQRGQASRPFPRAEPPRAPEPDAEQPDASEPRATQPLLSGRSLTQTSTGSPDDDLPWIKHAHSEE